MNRYSASVAAGQEIIVYARNDPRNLNRIKAVNRALGAVGEWEWEKA